MTLKPKCQCWEDPQTAAQRELMIDGIGTAVQVSVDQSCRALGICEIATPYVGGSVVAAILYWVAYELRGDGESPTRDQIAAASEIVIEMAKDRLAGSRLMDPDNAPTVTGSVH